MEFVKLRPLPRATPASSASDESRYFKTFKKRFTHDTAATSDVSAIQFNPGSEGVEVAVTSGTRVSVLSIEDDKVTTLHKWTKQKDLLTSVAYRSDGQLLAASDASGQTNIYSLAGGHGILRRFKGHEKSVLACTFGFGKEDFWTAGKDSTVRLWDVPTGQVKMTYTSHEDAVKCLSIVTPSVTASAGYDGKIFMYDYRVSSTPIGSFYHGSQIECLASFPSGGMLVSAGTDSIKLWDVSRMTESMSAPTRHSKGVTGIALTASGDHMWTTSLDGTLKVRETATMEVIQSFNCGDRPVTALAVKGDSVMIGNDQGHITFRDRRTTDKAVLHEGLSSIGFDSRGGRAGGSTESYLVAPSTGNKPDNQIDYLLRKFEYKKLVDMIISNGCTYIQGLAVLDELCQRGALEAGVRDLPSAKVAQVLEYLRKIIVSYPGYTNLVVKTIHAILDVNQSALDNEVADAAQRLHERITQELVIQDKIWGLQGAIETIVMHS